MSGTPKMYIIVICALHYKEGVKKPNSCGF